MMNLTGAVYHSFNPFLLPKNAVVVDIGACVGGFIERVAENGACRIFAYEPNRKSAEHLRDTYGDKITLKNVAVAGKRGKAKFYTYGENSMSESDSLFRRDDSWLARENESYEVDVISLNTVLSKHDEIDLLKIDAEGAEYEMLKTVHKPKLRKARQIIVEFHGAHLQHYESHEFGLDEIQWAVNKIIGMGFTLTAKNPQLHEYTFIRDDVEIPQIAVYTAIIGDRDYLSIPHVRPDNVDFICFTDRDDLQDHGIWQIVQVAKEDHEPCLHGKMFKMYPWEYLEGYKYSMWIDANLQITGPIIEQTFREMDNTDDMIVYKHPGWDCIYAEAEAIKAMKRADSDSIDRQIAAYKKSKFPAEWGMSDNGMIFRKHTKRLKKLMSAWYRETFKWGNYRDQITLPYVLWKTKTDITRIERPYRTSPDLVAQLSHVDKMAKPLLLLLVPLWNPEGDWHFNFQLVRNELAKKYTVIEIPKSKAYLFMACNELLGAKGPQFRDIKPYQNPDFFLASQYDKLIWYENDMYFDDPKDALRMIERMDENKVDILSATYVHSGEVLTYSVWNEEVNYNVKVFDPPQGDDLVEVSAVPLGFTAMRHGVFESMTYPWFSPEVVIDTLGKIGHVGHDIAVSNRIRRAGHKMYIDPTVRPAHIKKTFYRVGDSQRERNAVRENVAEFLEKQECDGLAEEVRRMKELT